MSNLHLCERGRLTLALMLALVATPAMAQSDAESSTPTPTNSGYSWLGFADEDELDFKVPRLARQPNAAPAAESAPVESAPPVAAPATDDASATYHRPPRRRGPSKSAKLKKAVASAHHPLFFDNDFQYVLDPCYDDWWVGDHLKRMEMGQHLKVDVGGQYRARYHSEQNMRGLGLTGRDDKFLLQRTRVFANVEAGENIRFFAEGIDAVSEFENFGPRPIEENRSDVLNLFIDATLWRTDSGQLVGRIGRQELLYGAQRLVSPLDWSNTRRTFDGAKFMWQGSDWDIDGFWSRPLRRDARNFDNSDLDQQFYGVYSTYKGYKNSTVDMYWLTLDNDLAQFRYDTIGGRHAGTYGCWLTEFEGAYQFGDNADGSDHRAGFVTAGIGRKLGGSWDPALWLFYDWASGSNDLAAGNGFNHLFPLGHKYLGFMDLFGRRNIETPNLRLSMKPTKRLTLLLWYYYFFLENQNDSPYNVNMSAFSNVVPGSADLGQEIDTTAVYSINARTKLLLGYSHFFSGDYYNTPGLLYSGDADFIYTQVTIGF